MKFQTQFSHERPTVDFRGETSRTRQEFLEEADINHIIQRYQTTGFLVDPSIPRARRPMFGDFTNVPVTQDAYNMIVQAQQDFDSLPIEIRRYFDFDAGKLLAFVSDKANYDKAVELGLIEKSAAEPVKESAAEPVKESAA